MNATELHDTGQCGGIAHACPTCDRLMDEQRARRIKAETRLMSVRKAGYASVATEATK